MKEGYNMILTIGAIAFILIGVIIAVLHKRFGNKYTDLIESAAGVVAIVFFVIGILGSVIAGCTILDVNIRHDVAYESKLYEKEVLEYRIEKLEEGLTGNELLYNDIVKFNNDLREYKRCAESLWGNWFHNQDIAKLDYIELPLN